MIHRKNPSLLFRTLGTSLLALSMVLVLGCSKESAPSEARLGFKGSEDLGASLAGTFSLGTVSSSARANAQAAAAAAVAAPSRSPATAPIERFLAVRHDLIVEVVPEKLDDAWAKVRDLCGALHCELLSSSLQRETPQTPGSAELEMRVLPADADKLLGGVANVAQVITHGTTSEDKTAEVIDVDAQIKNRTEFRDSLRAMLSDRSVKREMSDLLEIQRTLADTQAELDSSASKRQALAQLTGMQHVQIRFAPTPGLLRERGFSPIGQAIRGAGASLAENMGLVITFVASALPWLLVLVLPLIWVLRIWRRRGLRAKRLPT